MTIHFDADMNLEQTSVFTRLDLKPLKLLFDSKMNIRQYEFSSF